MPSDQPQQPGPTEVRVGSPGSRVLVREPTRTRTGPIRAGSLVVGELRTGLPAGANPLSLASVGRPLEPLTADGPCDQRVTERHNAASDLHRCRSGAIHNPASARLR